MVYERGIVQPMEQIAQTIAQRHWEILAQQPGAALLAVVREFYANAREHQDYKAKVRGRWVRFDSHAINQVYQLPDLPHDGLEQLRDEGPDFDDIIRRIATPAAQWTMSREVHRHFPGRHLHLEGKVWHYFIGAKFTPSLHFSTVSRDRALLIYAIVSGLSIDVGRIIQNSITYIASGVRGMGFGHPSLIYELCLRAGVPTSPMEELQQPKPPITPELVARLARERPPELARPRRQGQRAQEAETLEELRTELKELKKSVTRRMDRQQALMSHLVQIMTSVAAAGHIEIPTAPIFDLSSSEEEDEESAAEGEDEEEDSE